MLTEHQSKKSNLLIDSEKGYSLKTKTFYKMHMWYVRESLKRLTYLSGCNWKYMPKLYMACLKSYTPGIVSSHSSCHSLEIVFYSFSGKYTRKENREKNSNKSCSKAPPPLLLILILLLLHMLPFNVIFLYQTIFLKH